MNIREAIDTIMRDFYHITDDQTLDHLASCATIGVFEKGEIIQRVGERQANAVFLISGVVRCFFVSGKGERITDSFLCDFGYPSMSADVNRPSFLGSEAVTPVELLMIPLNVMFAEMERSTQVLWAYNQMLSWALLFHWQIKTSRFCFNGPERYEWFRRNFPEAEKAAYGKHIASFLGMTPETLSRIRKSEKPVEFLPVMVDMKNDHTSDELLEIIREGFEVGKQ